MGISTELPDVIREKKLAGKQLNTNNTFDISQLILRREGLKSVVASTSTNSKTLEELYEDPRTKIVDRILEGYLEPQPKKNIGLKNRKFSSEQTQVNVRKIPKRILKNLGKAKISTRAADCVRDSAIVDGHYGHWQEG